ncbi:MAG: Hint domain-containing protein [Roseicyclus sp.]|nr:Hint domain-containing protein [Roseicyclus sp.]
MTDMTPIAAALRVEDVARAEGTHALAPCSLVLTLDGALPAEHLYPGDRIITRHGARTLMSADRVFLPAGTPIVMVTRNAFGGRPDRDMWLPAAQRILIRDWRAKALYGQAQACVPAGQLADGDYVRLSTLEQDESCVALRFGRPEVLYADGLELASADPLRVPA